MSAERSNVCSICGLQPPAGAQACPDDGNTLFIEPPAPDPLIGQQLGDYQVLEPIGAGGMGLVYRAIQPVIKKRVAIKVLRAEFATDPQRVKGLLREAEAVNSISHRNIIDIFGFGQLPDGRHYIVMEYLEGEPLDAYLTRKGPLKPLEAVELLIDICDPLAGAHAAGVIHRDLKPSNVFLVTQPNGTRYLKLLDFGLAKQTALDLRTAQTSTGQIAGTPDYMAPEQCRGAEITFRTDLYALGVMGWQMLTGSMPFQGALAVDVMIKHIQEAPAPPSSRQGGVPPELDALVTRLMEKDPEARPASADAVGSELRQLGRRLLAEPAAPPTRVWTGKHPAYQPQPQSQPQAQPKPELPRRRPRWPIFAAALVAVAATAGGWLLWPAEKARVEPALGTPTPVPAPIDPPAPVALPAVTPPVAVSEAPTADASVPEPKRVSRPGPKESGPSAASLTRRIRMLELRLRRKTSKGAEPDPSALQLLHKQRLKVSLAASAAELKDLSKKLDAWERTFLPP